MRQKLQTILIISLVFLSSCSPEKRLARLLRKHPGLIKTDTIYRKDTVITSLVEKDSTFHFYQPDTVYIKEGKLTIKYITNKDSTVFLSGKCDPDTIIREIPFFTNNVNVTNGYDWKLYSALGALFVLLVAFIFGKLLK